MGRFVCVMVACVLLAVFSSDCSRTGQGSGGAGGKQESGLGGGTILSDAAIGTGGAVGSGGTTGSGGVSASGGAIRTDGPPSVGGTVGVGGVGGVAGRGGATASGGVTGRGGQPQTGGSLDAGNTTRTDGSSASCTITSTPSLSTKIATVGIVTWTTNLSDVQAAHIDFGLTTDYGMTAPVDLAAEDHRTLLLGMKQQRTYHYRIVASGPSGDCTSDDATITTGSLSAGLPKIKVTSKSTASPVFGGFLITGTAFVTEGSLPAYIVDADGELVWAYTGFQDVLSARMSWAGTRLWINSSNVPPSSGRSFVYRMTLDGLTVEDLSGPLVGMQLQLAVLPDDTVAFPAANANGCEDIKEYSPAGSVRTVANAGTVQGIASGCEVMSIQHSRDDDTLVFSDLAHQSIVKIRRTDGAMVWVLNGSAATLTGTTWQGGQSGLHVLGADRILLFANNSKNPVGGMSLGGDGTGSVAMELALDVSGKKATQVWSYKANPAIQSDLMGDVQRLPNGNTIVAYSSQGKLHEVDANGTVLQEWTWSAGASFGYVEKRLTLCGPPPR
jgi:hypothetical protein